MPHKRGRGFALGLRLGMLGVLVLGVAYPAWIWFDRIEAVPPKYAAECPPPPDPAEAPSVRAPAPQPLSDEDWKAWLTAAKDQSALLLNWTLLLMGGLVALATTTKSHPFKHARWMFLLLAPALSFLAGSAWAGLRFQRRLTHLVLNHCLGLSTAGEHLKTQSDLLMYAVIITALFTFVGLTQIVMGFTDATESSPAETQTPRRT